MSNGAGHIVDMMNRMKQNRELRSSNREKFREKGFYTKNHFPNKEKKKEESLSEEELYLIRQRILKQARKEQRRELGIFIVLVFCIAIALIAILF